jgi:hypothetical protein
MKIHHICIGTRHNETHCKLLNNAGLGERVGRCSGSGLDWLKHNAFTSKTPRRKSHWIMNINLSNEEQECKTGHAKGKALKGKLIK